MGKHFLSNRVVDAWSKLSQDEDDKESIRKFKRLYYINVRFRHEVPTKGKLLSFMYKELITNRHSHTYTQLYTHMHMQTHKYIHTST